MTIDSRIKEIEDKPNLTTTDESKLRYLKQIRRFRELKDEGLTMTQIRVKMQEEFAG